MPLYNPQEGEIQRYSQSIWKETLKDRQPVRPAQDTAASTAILPDCRAAGRLLRSSYSWNHLFFIFLIYRLIIYIHIYIFYDVASRWLQPFQLHNDNEIALESRAQHMFLFQFDPSRLRSKVEVKKSSRPLMHISDRSSLFLPLPRCLSPYIVSSCNQLYHADDKKLSLLCWW